MTQVRKVSASAGAEWLMGGFGLLRRSPLGLGLLGAIFGLVAALLNFAGLASPALVLVQQLAMMLLGPLLIAGLVWAAREVDQGRAAMPAHLLRGVRDGKAGRLWATLLPQFAAGLAAVVLLFVIVGPSSLQALVAAAEQAQANPDTDPSALIAALPVGRMFLWLLLVLVVGVLAGFFTFTAIPDLVFSDTGAIAAMKRSFRACMANLPALILFFVLLVIAAVFLSIAVQVVGLVVRLVAGDHVMLFVVQVLLMAVLMPVVTGALYLAWKQLLSNDAAGAAPAPPGGEGMVEA